MGDRDGLSFEAALQRLEQIVEVLDAGDLPLEEALRLFEEGMALRKVCLEQLQKAEAVVEMYEGQGVLAEGENGESNDE